MISIWNPFSLEKQVSEDNFRMQGMAAENIRYKKEHERMKARLLTMDEGNLQNSSLICELQKKIDQAEEAELGWKSKSEEVACTCFKHAHEHFIQHLT
jgi:hypothetical protein